MSVRSITELETVLEFDIDIVDLKEPHNGSLAPCDPSFWRTASTLMKSTDASCHLSVALGEFESALILAASVPEAVSYAKAGPSGVADTDELLRKWDTLSLTLQSSVEFVAVAYADAEFAGCLSPEEVFQCAVRRGQKRILIDTFGKQSGSSLELLGANRLRELNCIAQENGMWWALAGAIRLEDALAVNHDQRPDCFAVRGDICEGDRTQGVCKERLGTWQSAMKEFAYDGNQAVN